MTEETTTTTAATTSEGQQEKVSDDASVPLSETDSSSGDSVEASLSSAAETPSSRRKTVTFQTIEIKEHDMILGDHPSTTAGPAITIDWTATRSHSFSVDEYEQATTENRRRGQELRMPEEVRKGLLRGSYSEAEMRRARTEARKIQSQRNMSRAMEELETVTTLIESAGRKYKKWMRRRKGVTPEPAEAWVNEYKQQYKGKEEGPFRRSVSWHSVSPLDLKDDSLTVKSRRSSDSAKTR